MRAQESPAPDIVLRRVEVDFGRMSHIGKVRTRNEDHYLVATFERSMTALFTSLPEGDIPYHYADTAYGMLVADGMGGAAGGEVASRTAVSFLIELALRTPDWILLLDEELAKKVLDRLNERIKQVEAALIEKARIDPGLAGMGTTITVACSICSRLLIAHVGDSRAYMFRKGQLYRLTRDHTVAQFLADAGVIKPEAVQAHPARHLLTHFVGAKGGTALADLSSVELADGDQVLLCTDGLTDMVAESHIAESLARGRPAGEACRSLVEMALDAGGRDNVTVVIARYRMTP